MWKVTIENTDTMESTTRVAEEYIGALVAAIDANEGVDGEAIQFLVPQLVAAFGHLTLISDYPEREDEFGVLGQAMLDNAEKFADLLEAKRSETGGVLPSHKL